MNLPIPLHNLQKYHLPITKVYCLKPVESLCIVSRHASHRPIRICSIFKAILNSELPSESILLEEET